jgi:hypothetical protein
VAIIYFNGFGCDTYGAILLWPAGTTPDGDFGEGPRGGNPPCFIWTIIALQLLLFYTTKKYNKKHINTKSCCEAKIFIFDI